LALANLTEHTDLLQFSGGLKFKFNGSGTAHGGAVQKGFFYLNCDEDLWNFVRPKTIKNGMKISLYKVLLYLQDNSTRSKYFSANYGIQDLTWWI
jgi:hypothetical protein